LSNGLLFPVTTPAKATSHTSKLTSLTTRFTLAVLECKIISQELMHGLQLLNDGTALVINNILFALWLSNSQLQLLQKSARRIVHDYIHSGDSKIMVFFVWYQTGREKPRDIYRMFSLQLSLKKEVRTRADVTTT
jgi:hypothetical protein